MESLLAYRIRAPCFLVYMYIIILYIYAMLENVKFFEHSQRPPFHAYSYVDF